MTTELSIYMKLFIDTNTNKVVYAEAGKACVDFLLHILSLPLGSVFNLTRTPAMGSIGALYGSFDRLGARYLQEGLNKDCLLKPQPPAGAPFPRVPLFAPKPQIPEPKYFYTCAKLASDCRNHRDHLFVSDGVLFDSDDDYEDVPGGTSVCPGCDTRMRMALRYKAPPAVQKKPPGYVKAAVTYMIMDDLSIEPMCTSALLNRLKIEDVGGLQEREVGVDINVGLALLKASIRSETVLSEVFLLVNKAAAAASSSSSSFLVGKRTREETPASTRTAAEQRGTKSRKETKRLHRATSGDSHPLSVHMQSFENPRRRRVQNKKTKRKIEISLRKRVFNRVSFAKGMSKPDVPVSTSGAVASRHRARARSGFKV